MTTLLTVSLGLLIFHPAAVSAMGDETSNWPQAGGPSRNGNVALTGVDFDWSEGGPKVIWRTDVGAGFGGASVHDGEVFLLDREVGEVDLLRVLELENGEGLWDFAYEAVGRLNYPGSRTVPTVTEKHIYLCSGHGRVTCLDRKGRSEVWSTNLEQDYGGIPPGYGWSCSPLLVGDLVVLTALGEDVGLVAFDRFTGDEAWITSPLGTTHATPAVMDLLGKEQIVFVSAPEQERSAMEGGGKMTISSFDPEDGATLWEIVVPGSPYPIPGPVQVDGERFFVTGGYRGGSSMHRLSKGDDGYDVETLFHIDRGSQIHNPILHEENLYLVVNENWTDGRNRRKEGGLLCLGLDGDERWRTGDEPNFGRGPTLLAGEHLLVQDGYNGTLRVVKITPDGYEQIAETNVFEIDDRRDHQMWAPMALAGRHLLLRSQEELLCVEL